jgi:hypothetical protein
MRRITLVLVILMLLVPVQLRAEAPRYAVEVAVRSVTGSFGPLTSGMRVDALFFRTGDGNSMTTLLVLRNVEVDCSPSSANKDGRHPEVASLLLTQDQAKAVRALPAAAVQLVVISSPKRPRKSPDSGRVSISPRTVTGRGSEDQIVYAEVPPPSQASDDQYVWFDASKSVVGRLLRYLVWPAVAFVMLKTFSGTIRGARRCRKTVSGKRRTALKVAE